MTGSLFFLKQGDWKLAIFVYVMASIGFMCGNIFYDSILPSISKKIILILFHPLVMP